MANVPFMATVSLATAGQTYQLYSMLTAIDSTLPRPAQALLIQFDINAGAAHLFIGDAKMVLNTANYGAALEAGWSYGIDSVGANLLVLDQVYLYSDTNTQLVHITVVTR